MLIVLVAGSVGEARKTGVHTGGWYIQQKLVATMWDDSRRADGDDACRTDGGFHDSEHSGSSSRRSSVPWYGSQSFVHTRLVKG
jgi:hypothetical protein